MFLQKGLTQVMYYSLRYPPLLSKYTHSLSSVLYIQYIFCFLSGPSKNTDGIVKQIVYTLRAGQTLLE